MWSVVYKQSSVVIIRWSVVVIRSSVVAITWSVVVIKSSVVAKTRSVVLMGYINICSSFIYFLFIRPNNNVDSSTPIWSDNNNCFRQIIINRYAYDSIMDFLSDFCHLFITVLLLLEITISLSLYIFYIIFCLLPLQNFYIYFLSFEFMWKWDC